MGVSVGGWVCFGGSVVMGGFREAGRLVGPRCSLLTCGPHVSFIFYPQSQHSLFIQKSYMFSLLKTFFKLSSSFRGRSILSGV